MIEFCRQAYLALGVPQPPLDLIAAAAWCTYCVIDCYDPYSILHQVTDVNVSDDWQKYTFDIKDHKGNTVEADPELVETFIFVPGQDEVTYQMLLSQSAMGLNALPWGAGMQISDFIAGELTSIDAAQRCSDETIKWLKSQCALPNGEMDEKKWVGFFELGAWAAYLWFIGPPGRDFRHSMHDLFYVSKKEGIAILYDGMILDKSNYVRHERTPQSCAVCGLDSWCVDMAHIGGVTRFLCEKHLNGNLPLYGQANCGAKSCRATECPYHPAYGQNDGLINTLRGRGQLLAMAQQGKLSLESGIQPKLLAN